MSAERYLLETLDYVSFGEFRVFWKWRKLGYTSDIDDAGRFTAEEAAQACRDANFKDEIHEIAWKESDVLSGKVAPIKRVLTR